MRSLLHVYYLDLIELNVGLIFLVVLKIVMLLGMKKLSNLLSDDPNPNRVHLKPRLSPELNRIRWAVAALLVLAAAWQIRPAMLFVSVTRLIAVGTNPGIARWWVDDALWLNIWSVVIELSFAGLLMSFVTPRAVRLITAVLFGYSLTVWGALQGFGHLGADSNLLVGTPGTGLLIALSTWPLVAQGLGWKRLYRPLLVVYWTAFCVFQWVPAHQFWHGPGYRSLAILHPASIPGWLGVLFAKFVYVSANESAVMTTVLGVAAILLALGWIWSPGRIITAIASWLVLLLIWVFAQGLGLGGGFTFALGSAPMVALWVWMARFSYRGNGKGAML